MVNADSVYMRTVRRAITLAGGVDELAAILGVSSREIESWESGRSAPGVTQFLLLLDIVAGNPVPARVRR